MVKTLPVHKSSGTPLRLLRDRRQQGCCRRAYRDVFTACHV